MKRNTSCNGLVYQNQLTYGYKKRRKSRRCDSMKIYLMFVFRLPSVESNWVRFLEMFQIHTERNSVYFFIHLSFDKINNYKVYWYFKEIKRFSLWAYYFSMSNASILLLGSFFNINRVNKIISFEWKKSTKLKPFIVDKANIITQFLENETSEEKIKIMWVIRMWLALLFFSRWWQIKLNKSGKRNRREKKTIVEIAKSFVY